MKKRYLLEVVVILSVLFLTGCKKEADKSNEPPTQTETAIIEKRETVLKNDTEKILDSKAETMERNETKKETANIVQTESLNETTNIVQSESLNETEPESSSSSSENISSDTSSAEGSYLIRDELYQDGKIDVHYPQIQGLKDTDMEAMWNDRIKNSFAFEESDNKNVYTASYEIGTQTEDLFSFVILGSTYSQGAAHPYSFISTYNIDLKTGKNIRLADYADIDVIASNIIEGTGYEVLNIDKKDFDDYVAAYQNKEKLIELLQQYDHGEDDSSAYGYSYQKDGKTILCIGVPHALGDYVQIILQS